MLWEAVRESTGIFFFPQMALSVVVTGILVGYLIELARGSLKGRSDRPWNRTLDPLASMAVSVGLLGSVFSFAQAFSGAGEAIDVPVILGQLGTAYGTTVFGIITSLIAGFGIYGLDLATGNRPKRGARRGVTTQAPAPARPQPDTQNTKAARAEAPRRARAQARPRRNDGEGR